MAQRRETEVGGGRAAERGVARAAGGAADLGFGDGLDQPCGLFLVEAGEARGFTRKVLVGADALVDDVVEAVPART